MIPKATLVQLTAADRSVLEARVRAPTAEQRDVLRARIVLLPDEGRSTRRKSAVSSTQPIGEAQRDLLQGFNQHIVVERAMEMRLLRHRSLCALVQGDGGSVPVHR